MTVAGLVDSREGVRVTGDFPVFSGGRVTATKGRLGLEAVTVEHAGGTRVIRADCLAMSGGWNPTVHLTCHMNGRPVWDEGILSFVPKDGAVPGMLSRGRRGGVRHRGLSGGWRGEGA